jgi:NADPH:quinone reductase-like Zn-dependent oxidoreductase
MKAYEIRQFGIDKLYSAEHPIPTLGPFDVLIKIRAASLNYRDIMVASGTYNPKMKLPAVPLSDGAGEVVSVGECVSKWKVGDRVMPIFAQLWFDGESNVERSRSALGAGAHWNGVAREFAAFHETGLVKIPDHLSFEEAATLPCAAVTAWNALVVSGKLKAGDAVLTLGTGGVSIFALQIAKLFGARVYSTTGSVEKIQKLKELGAIEAINYRERDDWDKAVLELTDGQGVDHVIEVGGAGTLARSVASVRYGGHIALIGALDTDGSFNHVPVFMKAVRMQGIFVGSGKMFADLNKAITLHEMHPVIDRTFPFGELESALNYMQSGSHFGKIVVQFGDQS